MVINDLNGVWGDIVLEGLSAKTLSEFKWEKKCSFVCVWIYTHARKGHDPWELDGHVIVSSLTRVLGMEPRFSGRGAIALQSWAISSLPKIHFLRIFITCVWNFLEHLHFISNHRILAKGFSYCSHWCLSAGSFVKIGSSASRFWIVICKMKVIPKSNWLEQYLIKI